MKRITLAFEAMPRLGLNEYLLGLNGILEVEINTNENIIINVKYDSSLIDENIIKLEIIAFLDLFNVPSLLSFDKHVDNAMEYDLIIKDLCCEYCLRGMIDELIMRKGIVFADSDYEKNGFKKDNVMIHIKYDNALITLEEIKQIEKEFN